jgi:hypothetical protein
MRRYKWKPHNLFYFWIAANAVPTHCFFSIREATSVTMGGNAMAVWWASPPPHLGVPSFRLGCLLPLYLTSLVGNCAWEYRDKRPAKSRAMAPRTLALLYKGWSPLPGSRGGVGGGSIQGPGCCTRGLRLMVPIRQRPVVACAAVPSPSPAVLAPLSPRRRLPIDGRGHSLLSIAAPLDCVRLRFFQRGKRE